MARAAGTAREFQWVFGPGSAALEQVTVSLKQLEPATSMNLERFLGRI
jgi:hypothetical protein